MGDSEASVEPPAQESVASEPVDQTPAAAAPTPDKAPSEATPDAHAQPPSEPPAPGAPEVKKDIESFSKTKTLKAKSTVIKKPGFGQPQASKDLGSRSKDENYSMMIFKASDSGVNYQERAKITKYMNSYKLESDNPFNADKVYRIIVKVLKDSIEDNLVYDPDIIAAKAKVISGLIRSKIKEQDFDRYKLVCLVTIGEKKSYDIFSAARFLWDMEKDSFATHVHENMYLFVVASVFGLYYE